MLHRIIFFQNRLDQTNHGANIRILMFIVSTPLRSFYSFQKYNLIMCEWNPNRTSSPWPSPGCLLPPLQLCAGNCLLLADGCSPSNQYLRSKVIFVFSIYTCRCLASAVFSAGTNCSLCQSADGPEGSWEARWQHPKPRCLLKRLSSDDNSKDLCVDNSVKANGLSRQQVFIKIIPH